MSNFGCDRNSSNTVYSRLLSAQWIDERTRVVFLESLSFNPNSGLYTAADFAFEFFAGGGIILGNYFASIQLDWYSGINGPLLVIIQWLILSVVAVCLFFALSTLWKQKLVFFKVNEILNLFVFFISE